MTDAAPHVLLLCGLRKREFPHLGSSAIGWVLGPAPIPPVHPPERAGAPPQRRHFLRLELAAAVASHDEDTVDALPGHARHLIIRESITGC